MTDCAGQARLGRRACFGVVALLLAVAALGAPAETRAWTGGACPSTSSGVTVVVDFGAFGAGTVVRCAPGDPTTGFAALAGAGFSLEQVSNVPGFLCRIDGRPGAGQESCVNTPPASAYWVYWHAPRGGGWTYSSSGAATRNPAPGTVEGWTFAGPSGVKPPSVPPPPAPGAPKPTPTPRPPTPAPAPTAMDAPDPTSRPAPTAAHTPRAVTPTPTESPDASARPSDTPSSRPTPSAVDPSGTVHEFPSPSPDAVAASANAGSAPPAIPLGAAVGVMLAVAVGGTAAIVVRRRAAGAEGGP